MFEYCITEDLVAVSISIIFATCNERKTRHFITVVNKHYDWTTYKQTAAVFIYFCHYVAAKPDICLPLYFD